MLPFLPNSRNAARQMTTCLTIAVDKLQSISNFHSSIQTRNYTLNTYKTLHEDIPLPRFVVTQQRERPSPIPVIEAIKNLKATSRAKFDETIDIAINLGIDPRRGDQMVRGAATLPHGTGKTVRVCVFAKDPDIIESAQKAGADIIGAEDLIHTIAESSGSNLQFDKCVASPDMMPKLGKVARILGPRGLMPNPKLGTVTSNVADAIHALKRGRIEFRADKGGVIHVGIGKKSFHEDQLVDNIGVLIAALLAARPKGVKGSAAAGYLLRSSISSTMGPGVPVTIASLVQAAQARSSTATAL